MRKYALLIRWLLAGILCLTLSRQAIGAEPHHASPLESVKELDKPVTYSETKIPLGELVQKVAADTGVKLTAPRDVSDEPIAVVVKAMPARELLEEVADLLDYRWARRGRSGAERFEIWQDLASKQDEEALRQAVFAELEKRWRQEVDQYIRMAALSPAQIQRLLDEEKQRRQQLYRLTPDQQRALLNSPEEKSKSQQYGIAHALSSPIQRSLAGLLGGLTSQQWTLLRQGKGLTFSTRPQPGELPLPGETTHALSSSRPVMFPPGEVVFPNDPKMEELRLQRDKESQEQWAAAPAYQVAIWMSVTPSGINSSGGIHSLRVEATAQIPNAAAPSFFSGGPGSMLLINDRPVDYQIEQRDGEDSARRRAEGESDPVLGVKKRFKPEPPRADAVRIESRGRRPLRDLLPDLARTYDVQFLSDAYWNSCPTLELPAFSEPVSLFALLDRSAWWTHRWERRGKLIRLRARTWFFDRPREIPLRLVRRWKVLCDKYGALPLDDYVAMVTTLNDSQLDSVAIVNYAVGLPPILSPYGSTRSAVRLYASLAPAQRQTLARGGAVLLSEMEPAQRELFLTAVGLQTRLRAVPLDVEAALGAGDRIPGRFSLTTERFFRVRHQQEGTTIYRDAPAGPREAQPPIGTDADGPPKPPAAKTALPVSYPLTQLNFRLQYGPDIDERADILVASPP